MSYTDPYKQVLIKEAKQIARDNYFNREQTNTLIKRVLARYYREICSADIITKQDIEQMSKSIKQLDMKYTDNNTLNKWYKVDENRLIKRQLKEIENIGDLSLFARNLIELQKSLIKYLQNEMLPSKQYLLNNELLLISRSLLDVLLESKGADKDSIFDYMDSMLLKIEESKLNTLHTQITTLIISIGYFVMKN